MAAVRRRRPAREFWQRVASLATWAYAMWLMLTWSATLEQLVFGGCLALAVGVAMAPLGDVVAPARLADPRRLVALAALLGYAVARIVRANLSLARRIWTPSRPLAAGMVVVPTAVRTDAALAATGLITSLIVDNQIVDLDRASNVLQYHAVSVPEGDKAQQSEAINAPIERLLARVDRRP